VCAQGLPGCLPWGMFLTFFNDFLSQQKGLSVPVATMVRQPVHSESTLTITAPQMSPRLGYTVAAAQG